MSEEIEIFKIPAETEAIQLTLEQQCLLEGKPSQQIIIGGYRLCGNSQSETKNGETDFCKYQTRIGVYIDSYNSSVKGWYRGCANIDSVMKALENGRPNDSGGRYKALGE